jgi:preprotein translocase subunit SecA
MITPSAAGHRLEFRPPPPLLNGLDAKMDGLVGKYKRRSAAVSELREMAHHVDALAPEYVAMDDFQLHQRIMELRGRFRRRAKIPPEILFAGLAAVREAADRKLGLRPFIVQLMGALALHRGCLAEMATGEGKTLTAGLAAVLFGWTGKPCHIVTVNDYLVERDSEWMRPLYSFCGVRVGHVTGAMGPPDRVKGYDADVTYVTSKELLADFLRDRLRLGNVTAPSRRLIRQIPAGNQLPGTDGLVMRGIHSAIVDEADSLLIDEAITPLIISAPHKNELLEEAVRMAAKVVGLLETPGDYAVNTRYREIELSPAGREKLTSACERLPGLWRGLQRRDELIRQALVAREFYLRDKQYIISEGKIVIVDEFTGRQMPQRSWRQGLHQAIEAKENLEISDPSETIARLSFQRFFRCFHRLAGMTGTAREASDEFWRIYKLPVVSIPTNRPPKRDIWPGRVFPDQNSKWRAVAAEVQRLHATGRPILIGTRSVEASEKLAAHLAERELDFRVLNAIRHKEEAEIVAMAGEKGRITIATNMAGRGTDIKLGPGVSGLGGLHVLATERHESGRVDRQLFGRAGRQGDPGSAQCFVSLEDEILRRYVSASVQTPLRKAADAELAGWRTMAQAAFALAQRKAQKQAFKQRQIVLTADTWLEESLSFAGMPMV